MMEFGTIHLVVKVEGEEHTLLAISNLIHAMISRPLGGIEF
jgi:hypothetical protein